MHEDKSFYYPATMSLIGGISGGILATAGVIAAAILSRPVEKQMPHTEARYELFAPPPVAAGHPLYLLEPSTGRTWVLDDVPGVMEDKRAHQVAKPAYERWVRVDTVAVGTP